ncbi:hypothetical protein FQR65_LT14367 [Abscondita terminalis]|nr:hypothetical protein FQR65_LT14367 [Abscondita terminalis]
MRTHSNKKLPTVKKGDCVLLIIPKIDRGPSDPPNMTCVIIDQKNGVNQLACKYGIINGWFGSENLILAGASFMSVEDVDQTKSLSIREAVMKTSGGQGYIKCTCRPGKTQSVVINHYLVLISKDIHVIHMSLNVCPIKLSY